MYSREDTLNACDLKKNVLKSPCENPENLLFNKTDYTTKGAFNVANQSTLTKVEIFTDGACSGNPGPGGYGTILRAGGVEKELSGGDPNTTNNRMELMAVIEGLKALKRPCDITIYTDSQYVSNGITKGWAESWRKNGWRKADKKPAQNPDLWEILLDELSKHTYKIVWLKGHAGHPENERCDKLAVAESQKY